LTWLAQRRRGSAALEMALIAIPLIFFLLAVVELSRGMWTYTTLASAVKRGARFLIVHGSRCVGAASACQITIGDATRIVTQAGVGLDPMQMQLTFISGGQTYTCATASSCLTNGTAWPPAGANAVGVTVSVQGSYAFRPVMGFIWPGKTGGTFDLWSKSSETIQF
jgi:Flp pilus assembly protein TadG